MGTGEQYREIDRAARIYALIGRVNSAARTVQTTARLGASTGSGRLDELYRLVEQLAGAVADLASGVQER